MQEHTFDIWILISYTIIMYDLKNIHRAKTTNIQIIIAVFGYGLEVTDYV
jgi:hypothetical protein